MGFFEPRQLSIIYLSKFRRLIYKVNQFITRVKIDVCLISLWLFSILSWREKGERTKWEYGGRKASGCFLFTKNWIFTSLFLRSWWMFPVPETVQFHLQECRGELPVLVSTGIRPARGWEDMQRWGRVSAVCDPCLSLFF